MYLKSIRAQGFKSFADKLDLEINPGITGIVGPNGSGKSNIVDAVRWVLGEQSIKSLRGSSAMSDVIFSGSDSRPPLKRALVALTFDNSDKYLNSEFNEVEIKRIVYSTGENEYYLNNLKVRLKDITDLFIESGAGSGAFNIISQGNVADIVNSKASERRIIFESAAGVLKYKRRKEESLKKLEKTEENMLRIKLIIDELSKSVTPLKKQSEVAKKYLLLKTELESIDIALICKDINEINTEYKINLSEVEILKSNLNNFKNIEDESRLEKLKLSNLELEDKVNNAKEKLLSLTKKLSELSSEKQITLERQKYEVNTNNVDSNLVKLKEEELSIKKNIDIITREVNEIEKNIMDEKKRGEEVKDKLLVFKVKRSNASNKLQELSKQSFILENKTEILENNIMNDSLSPVSVRNIINNPRLKGIHNTIGKIIDVSDEFSLALDTALGFNKNFVVVESDDAAIEAINFLKENKLGRATFFPLNIIKGRTISDTVIREIKNIRGFIGVLSNLVMYDIKYQNIIENQLGNVIVVKDALTLSVIGKLIDYKYRVVSLDGEILHVGGSITGGTSKKSNQINEKNELNKLKDDFNNIKIDMNVLNNDIFEFNKKIDDLEEKGNVVNKYISLLSDELFNKKTALSRYMDTYKEKISELNGLDDLVSNKLSDKLVMLLENINQVSKEKELIEKEIKQLVNEKNDLVDEINILERKYRESNSNYNSLSNELKNKEILIAKSESKLDNLLVNLSDEYNLTYEYASVTYSLDMDSSIAREKVGILKKEMQSLGEVNIGSINEFDRLNKRYEFLFNQRNDLEKSSNELKNIITEMDEIMVGKFKTTFDKIKIEYSKIFKLMFKGGFGELKLSDPEDLLNTGIEIIASPPGKKINSTSSLSGGEKALTAIVLLFAMLEVKPSPFVILDEAEAALDEVNVDMFGKYLNSEKSKSQFILITHKKRMMEYAETLYGITMQESGVSKIVSAKLE
ncbi:MAG: AAA family ATPase, partial [Bacilli bacterium]